MTVRVPSKTTVTSDGSLTQKVSVVDESSRRRGPVVSTAKGTVKRVVVTAEVARTSARYSRSPAPRRKRPFYSMVCGPASSGPAKTWPSTRWPRRTFSETWAGPFNWK